MTKPIFTYGDKVQRKSGGPVVTVQRINDTAYHFAEGGFCLIADQDCYRLVEKASGYFLVAADLSNAPLDKNLQHGYEERQDFIDALRKLLSRWRGRTGQSVGERNGFLRLSFRDIPGGGHEEAWLPLYLLTPTAVPDYAICRDPTHEELIEQELDEAFGFD